MRDVRSSQDARVWVGADGRVHQESTRPPLSVHGALNLLAWTVAEARGMDGPGDRDDVFALVRFIDRHIDHITRVTELALEVDETLRQLIAGLRPVTGDARRKIGKCPQMVTPAPTEEVPEPEPERCDAVLYAPLNDDAIVCTRCLRKWPMSEWLTLGDALEPIDLSA